MHATDIRRQVPARYPSRTHTTATTTANDRARQCSRLLAVVADQKRREICAARDEDKLAHLRDIHLAAVLRRLQSQRQLQAEHALLQTVAYVSDHGDVRIVLREHRLGSGWTCTARLVSATTHQQVTVPSAAECCGADTLFRFQPPTLCDEWTVQLMLTFSPPYDAPAFVAAPVTALAGPHHIDVLDAIIPCASPRVQHARHAIEHPPAPPCLCEIWLALPAARSADDLATQAQKLLLALLFDAVPPQPQARVADILLSNHTAEFCVPGATHLRDAVTVMCIPEQGRLALRIRSCSRLAYSAVVAAAAKRLLLLLPSTGAAADALVGLNTKHADMVVMILNDPGAATTQEASTDFALVADVELSALADPAASTPA